MFVMMRWFVLVVLFVCFAGYIEMSAILPTTPITESSAVNEKDIHLPPQSTTLKLTTRSEAECLPDTEWRSQCHSCRCNADSIAECVKLPTCDKENAEPYRCKPNSTFMRECNWCSCLETGSVLCTLNDCAPKVPDEEILGYGKECEIGTGWNNRCNQCYCNRQGIAYCTLQECPGKASETKTCAPGSKWRNKCNTCSCTDQGKSICTTKGCDGDEDSQNAALKKQNSNKLDKLESIPALTRRTRRDAPNKEPAKTCLPGQEFRLDCNKCLCDNEGQDFSCTRIDCTALNNNNGGTRRKREVVQQAVNQCEPGSVFDQDCNVCRCTSDGRHATCSLRRCSLKPPENEETTSESNPNFRCTPGEQFERACNHCTCSADGRSVFCTLLLCDKEITGKI